MYGEEPHGTGNEIGEHAATLTYGKPGIIHRFKTVLLQDEKGEPAPVYSIAIGCSVKNSNTVIFAIQNNCQNISKHKSFIL